MFSRILVFVLSNILSFIAGLVAGALTWAWLSITLDQTEAKPTTEPDQTNDLSKEEHEMIKKLADIYFPAAKS